MCSTVVGRARTVERIAGLRRHNDLGEIGEKQRSRRGNTGQGDRELAAIRLDESVGADAVDAHRIGAEAHAGGQQIPHRDGAGAAAGIAVRNLDAILDHVAGHRDLCRGRFTQNQRHPRLIDGNIDAHGGGAAQREYIAVACARDLERLAVVGASQARQIGGV